MKIPAGHTLARNLFTRPRLLRLRRAGLLPPPVYVGGYAFYSDAALAELERLLVVGGDAWIMREHGRGRPSLAEIARLAGV